MSNAKLRKVKEVNGWKVNHPHSAANIFYTLFTLIVAALPVAYFFLPVTQLLITDSGTIELIETGIEFVKYLLKMDYVVISPTFGYLVNSEYVGSMFEAAPYMIVASAGVLLLMCLFSAILIILFLVNLIKGYLKHSGSVKTFTIINFILSLGLAGIYLALYFGAMTTEKFANQTYYFEFWWPLYVSSGYFLMVIIISIIRTVSFKDSIPEAELEYHDDGPTVEHLTKVHEVTKVKYEQSSTLPNNLESIGGHAFSENQSLIVANIPNNITKIGNSAFANCLKLRVVSIPKSVNEIGFNCFFNCVELERINYSGTKSFVVLIGSLKLKLLKLLV